MSLSKPLTLRHLCHLLNNILGLFYHRHIVFLTISLIKNTKSYLPKKSPPEWPRNKLLATIATCELPQNGYNVLIIFLHLWNKPKGAIGPAGNRSSPPWASYTTALTPLVFFTLLNPFFSLWNRLKEKPRGTAWNRAWPLHHRGKRWTPLGFLFHLILSSP